MTRTLVLVSETFSPTSGWGRVAYELTLAARENGWVVVCVASDRTGSEGAPKIYSIHDSSMVKLLRSSQFANWMRSTYPNAVVHVVTEPHVFVVSLISNRCVATLHGTYARLSAHGGWIGRWMFQRGIRACQTVTAVSQFTANQLPKGLVRRPVVVIPNGVGRELLELEPVESDWKRTASPRILSVGAVKSRKGFVELVYGFAKFRERNPEAVLAIVGERSSSEYDRMLERDIERLGLRGSVHLVDATSQEQLAGWYRWCDLFALTPIESNGFEGFGLVYLEANLFGKPCLGVATGGAAEAISDQTGVRIRSVEPEEIAKGLDQVMRRTDWRFDAWLETHDWKSIFVEYQKAYLAEG